MLNVQEYDKALKYVTAILRVEPRNRSALELRDHIDSKRQKGCTHVHSALSCSNYNVHVLFLFLTQRRLRALADAWTAKAVSRFVLSQTISHTR